MKNITSVVLSKYQDNQKYQGVENGIYKDLINKRYVITLRFELEENENSQYPLEDILNKYYLNCTDHIKFDDDANVLEAEVEDGNDDDFESLEVIKKIAALVDKRVYNREYNDGISLL